MPDVAGQYVVALVVTDLLGRPSQTLTQTVTTTGRGDATPTVTDGHQQHEPVHARDRADRLHVGDALGAGGQQRHAPAQGGRRHHVAAGAELQRIGRKD